MKDTEKLQKQLQETFTKAKEEHEATHDELVQQIGYALDAVKFPPAHGAVVTNKEEFEKAQKNPAPPPPGPKTEQLKVEKTEHKTAEHTHTAKK